MCTDLWGQVLGPLGEQWAQLVLRQLSFWLTGLCLHTTSHLSSAIPVLLLTGSGLGPGPGSNKLKGGFQNDACQHQCTSGRMNSQNCLRPVSMSPGWVQVASCLSRKFSKVNRWVWPRTLSMYFFCLAFQNMWFHVCPLSVGSPCPKALWLSLKLALLDFNTRCSYSLFPGWRNCELGSLIWALDSPFLEEILHNCHYCPISDHSSGVTILLHHPPIHVIEIPYLYF